MKDNFSTASGEYASYRPTYPPDFYNYLFTLLPNTRNAWDCGTGNGQVAAVLAGAFENVYATDISRAQLDQAPRLPNVHYSVQPAEKTDFPDGLFDLVIVAQAIHWFDFDRFYSEVRRTAGAGAVLCALGYGRIVISPEIDELVTGFYENVIGPYWDPERRYIDEGYQTLPFPFEEIPSPSFTSRFSWSADHLTGYLNTWSAVRHFTRQNGYNPIEQLRDKISRVWGADEKREVAFPLLLRIGRTED